MRFSDWDFSFSNLSSLTFSSDIDGFFSGPHLDVSLGRKIGTDSTVSSISSSSTFSSSVDSNVFDGEIFQVFSVSVGFEVVDQTENNSDTLFWPSTQSLSELSGLTGSSDTTEVFQIWNASSVGQNILQVLFSFWDSETFNCVCCLIGVLIMNSQVLSGGSGNFVDAGVS